jgi:hypothetical protein
MSGRAGLAGPFVLRGWGQGIRVTMIWLLTGDAAASKVNQAVGLAVGAVRPRPGGKELLGDLCEMQYQIRNDA